MSNVIRFPVERLRPREQFRRDVSPTGMAAARLLCEAGVLRMYSSMDDLPDVEWSSDYALKRAAIVGVAQ